MFLDRGSVAGKREGKNWVGMSVPGGFRPRRGQGWNPVSPPGLHSTILIPG